MSFLSNRNLQNRIFRNLLKQSYCLQDSLNACWEVKA